ncbi:MAG: hypothetical protein HYW15_00530 [Candidatus Giovannonibacteria bacterium]|nr:MAG: hypothetical protein HYW15_00530 [Candidatus Giovannonibacteria bacterium]
MSDLIVALLVLWLCGLAFAVLAGAVRGSQQHGALAYFRLTGWTLGGIFETAWGLLVWLLAQVGHAVEGVARHFAAVVGFAAIIIVAIAIYHAYYLYLLLFGAP